MPEKVGSHWKYESKNNLEMKIIVTEQREMEHFLKHEVQDVQYIHMQQCLTAIIVL